jgi:hypothetical protein
MLESLTVALQDSEWNEQARNETQMQRLDRNWAELLQELRVLQTGVQLLTGFLLTISFQSRFTTLDGFERTVYLLTVALSVTSTGLLIAPVGLHRGLFRRHARHVMVAVAHRLAVAGLTTLAMAIVGVVLLIFDVVACRIVGLAAAAVIAGMLAALWLILPAYIRSSLGDPHTPRNEDVLLS